MRVSGKSVLRGTEANGIEASENASLLLAKIFQEQHCRSKTSALVFSVGILIHYRLFFISSRISPFSSSKLVERQKSSRNLCHMAKLESNYDHFVRILMMNRWDNSCKSFFFRCTFFSTLYTVRFTFPPSSPSTYLYKFANSQRLGVGAASSAIETARCKTKSDE